MTSGEGSREGPTGPRGGPDQGAAGRARGLCWGPGARVGSERAGPRAPSHPEQQQRWGAQSPWRAAHRPHWPQGHLLPASQTKAPGMRGPDRNRTRKPHLRAASPARPPLRFPSWPRRAPWVPFTRGARVSVRAVPGSLCDSRQEGGQRASVSLPRDWGPQSGRLPRPTLCP